MKTPTIELVCPRCYSSFNCPIDEYDPDEAICEFCGTKLVKLD